MEEIWYWIRDNLPVWAVVLILAIIGLIKYGPHFFKEVISIAEKYHEKSDLISREYIAMLKRENQRLQSEKKALEIENKILKEQKKTG